MHNSFRISYLQVFHQTHQRLFLGIGARVFRVAFRIQPADVADANRCGILPKAMRPYQVFAASFMHRAVQIDYIVVADSGKASGYVPLVDVVSRKMLSFLGGRTVKYDFVYLPHFLFGFQLIYQFLPPSSVFLFACAALLRCLWPDRPCFQAG